MTDLDNCKVMLENARIPFYVDDAASFPGYHIVRTPKTHFVFNHRGALAEMHRVDEEGRLC